jgi:hypothetical protein
MRIRSFGCISRDEAGVTKMAISALSGCSLKKTAFGPFPCPAGFILLIVASAALVLFFPIIGRAGEKYGTFTAVGEMNIPRSYHTATLLPNGKVLIAGGRRSFRDELDSAELYDPVLYKFIPTGKMLSARAGHTATLLPGGKVLIAGGFQPGEALASAELYDPVSGMFSPTGSMVEPRQWHTATLLPNGRVLIAGGGSNATGITPTAELYDPAAGEFVATSNMTVARALHYATALNEGDILIVGGVMAVRTSSTADTIPSLAQSSMTPAKDDSTCYRALAPGVTAALSCLPMERF